MCLSSSRAYAGIEDLVVQISGETPRERYQETIGAGHDRGQERRHDDPGNNGVQQRPDGVGEDLLVPHLRVQAPPHHTDHPYAKAQPDDDKAGQDASPLGHGSRTWQTGTS